MSKCALYCRVSTQEQETANQRLTLESEAQRRGFEVVQIYEESEGAWKSGHQRELSRLLSDARRRKFDYVLVWALDRLSREGALRTLQLVHTLRKCGVKVISLQEPWTESDTGLEDILLAVCGWVSQYESKRRSERTLAGLERARREGKRLGRPPGRKDKRKRKKRSVKREAFLASI